MTDRKEHKMKPGRRPTEGMTPSQERIMQVIRNAIDRDGLPPTVKEIAEALGMKTPSAHEQVQKLVKKGFIRRTPRKARSIEIVEQSPEEEPVEKKPDVARLVPVPIIGEVAAGIPILAVENHIGELLMDSRTARGPCFALKVKGDSMIDAEIFEGDYVVVRHQALAENGDIVVAILDGEATVKRLYISEETIELRPENRSYQPIVVPPGGDIRILGKVLAVRGHGAANNNE
ncbi:SOS-response transcriptional repressor, LexA [Magnetococcus marinus MC-1]|uniref:LexA repressor n=1 Tax=Magnetococcus marinus (strain ATCC BAA-1437 / JCM 17883 / MC-1) TaxID=156889 RepID=LEXA_MAGMM|nr:transcriptional repressor LexA [Magnetococcus marinus]A0L9E2.1 RecName: Full=LexA repressor [Magnetococcus marinus MC-1]ABK44585.1 SOS-response transcriptional repressor, LexA [Magnetococcus marinus MC-1]